MALPLIGEPLDRADGKPKVLGQAQYTADLHFDGCAHAVILYSTIARGRIVSIADTDATAQEGVIGVMTHKNAPRVRARKNSAYENEFLILQDDRIHYDRQPIAVVLAETLEAAIEAATLMRVSYEEEPPVVELDQAPRFAPDKVLGDDPDTERGEPERIFPDEPVRIEAVYTTPTEHHNPMEPHATAAVWDKGRLTVFDSTQYVCGVRGRLAAVFGISERKVRVVSRFIGGGFGSKGPVWPHVPLAAMASRFCGRPVRLVLSRPAMFGSNGHRPQTVQRLRLGARADGKLAAVLHDTVSQTCDFDEWTESSGLVTRMLYATPNLHVTHRLARTNLGKPTFMRAPGEATGTFALESAMDELAYAAGLDPIELRLRNYADLDPDSGLPFSSKSLRDCYEVAARNFGWADRSPRPRSMRQGRWLIGMGMATATYPMNRDAASARVSISSDGRVVVQSATHDLGTGSYTVFSQLAALALGVPCERVRVELGDTDLPPAPISAGSMSVASVGSAVYATCRRLRDKLLALAAGDERSPLYQARPRGLTFRDGGIYRKDGVGESYPEILGRIPLESLDARSTSRPGKEEERYSMHAFGAQFALVRVDPDLGEIRVDRHVGAFAVGRVLNEKTTRSQLVGGIIFGIGMALLEETIVDTRTGRIMSANLADYRLPVHADVRDIEVHLVPEEDGFVNPIGAKGAGEIGITGVAAAIANAVYHATGVRIRDLPIRPEKLLTG